jgi:ABC-type antimicrobial peptide transport system permease subunit
VELTSVLSRVLKKVDPTLPFTFHTWDDELGLVMFPARAATVTLGVMGLLAAILAATGIFGMAAYSVSKRRKEFGIRIALGTRATQLMHAAIGRPLALLLSGSVLGLILGVLATKVLGQIVYEATPRNPIVLIAVLVAMTLVGLLAVWVPARRALATDAAELLREET